MVVLMAGIAATISANLASGLGDGWLGAAISTFSGVALILISEVAMWLANQRRILSGQGGVNCHHPAPPVSLAEVLPIARAELRRRGERYGEKVLADQFQTTRHQVRLVLGPEVGDG